MAILEIPDRNTVIEDFNEISDFLVSRGIQIEKWNTSVKLSDDDDQETILKAYEHKLKPFMEKNNFQSADVVNIHSGVDNIEKIRQKFLKEHTHSEDEVRFFVEGEGTFWFNLDKEVFNIKCSEGDFLSVPAGQKHWFDIAPKYRVKAIRIFSNTEGWTPHYTGSGIDEKYLK